MKVRREITIKKRPMFAHLKVGDVFTVCEGVFMKVPLCKADGKDANTVCLTDGDLFFTSFDEPVGLVEAELVIKEVR